MHKLQAATKTLNNLARTERAVINKRGKNHSIQIIVYDNNNQKMVEHNAITPREGYAFIMGLITMEQMYSFY